MIYMAQNTDLYHLLKSFAKNTGSPYVEMAPFIASVEKHTKRYASERPEWARWSENVGRKIWEELPTLEKEEKCKICNEDSGVKIFMPNYYIDIINDVYMNLDESADLPFPEEQSFKFDLPYSQIKPINVEFDFSTYLDNQQETKLPVLKLIFPEKLGNTLILADLVPKRLPEACLLKIRNYLRTRNNKEFILHKLAPSFQGKESQFREAMNNILVKPFESIRNMESGGDFIFLFWSIFCNLIKKDIKQKNELLPEDIAALQSVYVMEVFNGYFKKIATRKKETELALKNLDLQLEKPPYLFTLDAIIKLRDSQGVPLLGQYTKETLEDYIKTKTAASNPDQLPELLVLHGQKGEQWFIKKKSMIPLCMKLLGDARIMIRKSISARWLKLMKDYSSEPAMKSDAEFEKLLSRQLNNLAPILAVLLEDNMLYLTYVETADIPAAQQIFKNRVLIPMSELLLLQRKALLSDTKILLPFWHSMPFFLKIITFFKHLGKKKNQQKKEELAKTPAEEVSENASVKKDAQKSKLKQSADDFIMVHLPTDKKLDDFLMELQKKWNRILNEQARKDLAEDVNALVRDRVRRMIRLQQNAVLTEETISRMTKNIITDTPALHQFEGENLTLYVELYIAKLVSNIKM
ncbi:MAG: hypothetical protein LBV20_03845 [Treponema sp.]|jgi:hypothetical protein|nr:hypothetical protein [Treponema sp.]